MSWHAGSGLKARKKAGKADEMSAFLVGSAGQATEVAKLRMSVLAAALVFGENSTVARLPRNLAGPACTQTQGQINSKRADLAGLQVMAMQLYFLQGGAARHDIESLEVACCST